MKIYKIAKITELQLQNITRSDGLVVEHTNIQGYDLALIKFPPPDINLMGAYYELALQKEGKDFTNPNQVMDKQQLESIPPTHGILNELKSTITSWKQKYFPIVVCTGNSRKEQIYLSILKKLGFNFKTANIRGTNYNWLTK